MAVQEACGCGKPDIQESSFGPFCLGCGRNLDISSHANPVSTCSWVSSPWEDCQDDDVEGLEEIHLPEDVPAILETAFDDELDAESEEPTNPEYIHKPLQLQTDIRLIRLLPSRRYEDEIHCRIFHSKLVDCTEAYEALSYTWGNAIQRETIRCNGASSMEVTQNCADAMRDLRHPFRQKILWIDAICIDQSSVQERNHQVALMSKIYSQAKRVQIYTGKEHSKLQEHLHVLRSGNAEHIAKLEQGSFQNMVSKFLSRPWFTRVWVLQEVAMAREALVFFPSGESIGWTYLSIANLSALGIEPVDTLGDTPPVLRLAQAEQRPLKDIISLLNIAGVCQSSDPRDKIYALLGLMDTKNDLGLSADYGKTMEDLYQEVTVLVIKAYNHLDILSYVMLQNSPEGYDEEPAAKQPSWIPDLNNLPRLTSMSGWRKKAETPFARNPVAAFPSLGKQPLLSVQVLPLDRTDVIEVVNEAETFAFSHDEQLSFIVAGEVDKLKAPSRSGLEIRHQLLRKGLFAISFLNKDDETNFFWHEAASSLDRELSAAGFRLDALKYFSRGRDLRLTQGSFAICPEAMASKDVICAVRGVSVPVVLRRVEPGRWRLVGECYLHGFRAPSFARDYGKLLGPYVDLFKTDDWAWEMPEFFDMRTIDGEGNLPWVEVVLV